MRLWLNHTGPISLREQLITQLTLAILAREILPGQRLPSTRDLARRFGIHPNTASSAYRQMEGDGWIEFRRGSGVYVRAVRPGTSLAPEMAVDHLIGELAAKARKIGVSDGLVRERLRQWLALAPPDRWLLIEPDPELGRIVLAELAGKIELPITCCTPQECTAPEMLDGSLSLVLPSKAAAVRALLPPGTELTTLEVHPVAPELHANIVRYFPGHSGDLVGIASRWVDFQRIAQTMLVAAGLAPETLLIRDATQPGWKRGLDAASAVVCDAALAPELPKDCFPIVFRLISERSIEQLRRMEAALIGAPAGQAAV
jgi:DNA-binding transcriptional regulator YhcF (GntR family)